MALSVRVPRTRSVAAAPRGRIAGPGFLGLTGDGISGRGRSRDYVLGAALAPIETEFCLFAAPCGQRRQIVYGNRGFMNSTGYRPISSRHQCQSSVRGHGFSLGSNSVVSGLLLVSTFGVLV